MAAAVYWKFVRATAVLLLAGSAACSSVADGSPEAAQTTTKSAAGAPTYDDGAESSATRPDLSVPEPLDASPYLEAPCSVLKPAQLRKLDLTGVGNPNAKDAVARNLGPTCTWSNRENVSGLGIGFATGNKAGLAGLYQGKGSFAYFEPLKIDGYPAIVAGLADNRAAGLCGIYVALNDQLVAGVDTDGGDGAQSCADAKEATSELLRTLKGSS